LGLAAPRYKRKHPIKVPKIRGLYIAVDWFVFGSGVDLALQREPKTNQPKWRGIVDPGMPGFLHLGSWPRHFIRAKKQSKCLKAKGCALPWTGSSLDKVSTLPYTRTKNESVEMAGNIFIRECPDCRTLGLAKKRHMRRRPIKVPIIRGLYSAVDWFVFGSGVDLALQREPKTNQPKWRGIVDPVMP
jgi:hypothetical protein